MRKAWIPGNYCFGKKYRQLEVMECFYAAGGRDSKGSRSAGWVARFELREGVYAETPIMPTQASAEQLLSEALNELTAERSEAESS